MTMGQVSTPVSCMPNGQKNSLGQLSNYIFLIIKTIKIQIVFQPLSGMRVLLFGATSNLEKSKKKTPEFFIFSKQKQKIA